MGKRSMRDAVAQRVDVLVVGAGPAGSTAAYQAASAGLRVLVVDHKKQFGHPVQCAEFVPAPLGRFAHQEEIFLQRVDAMRTYLPSGEASCTESPGFMVDRQAFDENLARRASESGAFFLTAARLVGIEDRDQTARINSDGKQLSIEYRAVVAADGPVSTVARCLGLANLPVLHTRQYTVQLKQPLKELKIWLNPAYPGGYAWLFPKGNKANLGLGVSKNLSKDLKTLLDDLHAQLIKDELVGRSIFARTGGLIPVGGIRDQLYVGNIVFAGDAAGLTHPITGAGIDAAVVSGELAGRAVVEQIEGSPAALENYRDEVVQCFGAAIQRALQRRRFLKNYWESEKMDDDIMKKAWVAYDEYFAAQNLTEA